MNRYELLGIEEIDMVCELCHKQHIGKAYTFRNLDTLDILRTGSTCAIKTLGIKAKTLDAMKAKFRNEIVARYQDMIATATKDRNNGDSTAQARIDNLFQEQIGQEKMYR